MEKVTTEAGFELSGLIGLIIGITLFVAVVATTIGLPLLIFHLIKSGC